MKTPRCHSNWTNVPLNFCKFCHAIDPAHRKYLRGGTDNECCLFSPATNSLKTPFIIIPINDNYATIIFQKKVKVNKMSQKFKYFPPKNSKCLFLCV